MLTVAAEEGAEGRLIHRSGSHGVKPITILYSLQSKRGVDISLKMNDRCQSCEASTPMDGVAWICSHECTFCDSCRQGMERCPNCSGELVRRPRREPPRDGA